jgi:hypothetical protein
MKIEPRNRNDPVDLVKLFKQVETLLKEIESLVVFGEVMKGHMGALKRY